MDSSNRFRFEMFGAMSFTGGGTKSAGGVIGMHSTFSRISRPRWIGWASSPSEWAARKLPWVSTPARWAGFSAAC